MAANLDYLSPDLKPLEEAANAYLAAERELRRLSIAERNEPLHDADVAAADAAFAHRPATGSFDQYADELQQQRTGAEDDLRRLRAELLSLLPTRDEWVKVNLGYGPSRVGAWRVPGAAGEAERFEIRVVQ